MRVRGDILRVYQSLHTWTGVISGIFLFIAFYAGALTMFKPQLDEWARQPSDNTQALSVQQIDSTVEQLWQSVTQHASPDVAGASKGFQVNLITQDTWQSPVTWRDSDVRSELRLNEPLRQASIEDGKLVVTQTTPSNLAILVDFLHRTAGIPGSLGHDFLGVYLLGIVAILYFLALVSGVVVLLPTLVKQFFTLRRNKTQHRFWLDSHNLVGITSLPFHIVISFTAIVFAFHHEIYEMLDDVVYPEKVASSNVRPAPTDRGSILLPSALIEKAKEVAPGYQAMDIEYFGLTSARAIARVGMFNEQATMRGPITDYAYFHAYNGKLMFTSGLPGDDNAWSSIVGGLFATHFGSFGGIGTRFAYFILGLSGAFLFFSGNLLWLEKRKVKHGAIPLGHRVLSVLTISCTLGSVIGVALCMVATRYAAQWGQVADTLYFPIYYSVFIASLVYAIAVGSGRAGLDLLGVAFVSVLLIPVTACIAVISNNQIGWVNLNAISVDMMALIVALCLLWLKRVSRKRLRVVDSGSVWIGKQQAA